MTQFALDSKNDKLCGVCSGLAKYLDFDVTLVRVGFVLATFFTGFAILAYIILAIVAPEDFEV